MVKRKLIGSLAALVFLVGGSAAVAKEAPPVKEPPKTEKPPPKTEEPPVVPPVVVPPVEPPVVAPPTEPVPPVVVPPTVPPQPEVIVVVAPPNVVEIVQPPIKLVPRTKMGTCRYLKERGAGRKWYKRLKIPYYFCNVPKQPPGRRTPAVTG